VDSNIVLSSWGCAQDLLSLSQLRPGRLSDEPSQAGTKANLAANRLRRKDQLSNTQKYAATPARPPFLPRRAPASAKS
jgi:hypothetical protein